MKSVVITNKKTGELLIKILHRKNGTIELITAAALKDQIEVEVRDNDRNIVHFGEDSK